MIPVLRAKISDHDLFGIINASSMKEVMRHESSKWLWVASIIMVRTGISHKSMGDSHRDRRRFLCRF